MAKSQPTHEAFAVTERGRGKKPYWHKIGAAWAHEDGKGLALRLDYLPLNGQAIVLREPLPEKDEADDADTSKPQDPAATADDIDL